MQIPDWLDRQEYPFSSQFLDLDGGRMHYVDEGQGRPIVMVHGTPTWSFLYRHLITELAGTYRCIAPDHIGFGLSDKPTDWSYRPVDHARNLRTLIERLELRDIILMVHDFGGPIGLSYAIEQPDNVSGVVLCNTWMWSLQDDPTIRRMGQFVSGPIGKFLYMRLNFSPRVLIRSFWGDKSKLTRHIHQHYTRVFPRAPERQSTWVLARELLGSSAWYAGLWQQREQLREKPLLFLWGMRDPAFKPDALARWQEAFPHGEAVTFPDAGHFVQEEVGRALGPVVDRFCEQISVLPQV
ncbi:MAG: alpha/beta fold hydrolase [Chloroflexaceae bacterium]